jgi:thiol-disulfide isomerase/thioredoxin
MDRVSRRGGGFLDLLKIWYNFVMKNPDLIIHRKRWYKRWWGIVIIVLIPIVSTLLPLFIYQFVTVLGEYKSGSFVDPKIFEENAPHDMNTIIDNMAPWLGNKDANIVIVEFGDFNCPYCLQASAVIKKVVAEYPDDVKFVWRNFPVIKDSSVEISLAGVCAHRQQKFWLYHDMVFLRQGTVSIGNLDQIAREIGLDMDKYTECMKKDLTMASLRKDFYTAEANGITGTPTFFINGVKAQGVISFEVWKKMIDTLLPIYE